MAEFHYKIHFDYVKYISQGPYEYFRQCIVKQKKWFLEKTCFSSIYIFLNSTDTGVVSSTGTVRQPTLSQGLYRIELFVKNPGAVSRTPEYRDSASLSTQCPSKAWATSNPRTSMCGDSAWSPPSCSAWRSDADWQRPQADTTGACPFPNASGSRSSSRLRESTPALSKLGSPRRRSWIVEQSRWMQHSSEFSSCWVHVSTAAPY